MLQTFIPVNRLQSVTAVATGDLISFAIEAMLQTLLPLFLPDLDMCHMTSKILCYILQSRNNHAYHHMVTLNVCIATHQMKLQHVISSIMSFGHHVYTKYPCTFFFSDGLKLCEKSFVESDRIYQRTTALHYYTF